MPSSLHHHYQNLLLRLLHRPKTALLVLLALPLSSSWAPPTASTSPSLTCENQAQRLRTPEKAVLATFSHVAFPTVVAVCTTVFGLGSLLVAVADTGPGIPARIKTRIFEPFFTTRGHGRGKGLGLTVCREIVRSYGGSIRFSSQPGKGAEFRLALPAHTPVDGKQAEWPFSIG